MQLGVLKETWPGENRVALVPVHVAEVIKAGHSVLVETGAGTASGFTDQAYSEKGAAIVDRSEVLEKAEVVLAVRHGNGAEESSALADLKAMKTGQKLVGMLDPYAPSAVFDQFKAVGISAFAMETIPRITRAQSMDVLSSMANVAGYKSVLLAANHSNKLFPMMMTAAGTIVPSKVFILGAGVAGLQAIATAKRLGGVVSAYDVRPAVKEQVESLGAKFVEFQLETAEGSGGYAKEMGEEFYKKQQELMTEVLREMDVVITTAAIPGKPSPRLITAAMVEAMKPGAVIVDLAAERGGNCELSVLGQVVEHNGVTIVSPENIASQLAFHASQLYSKNLITFLKLLSDKEGTYSLPQGDEIIDNTLVVSEGEVPNERFASLFTKE